MSQKLAAAIEEAVAGIDFGEPTISVPARRWVAAAAAARAHGFDYLDLLTAWESPGGFTVALQLWSLSEKQRIRLTCEVETEVPTLTDVFPGVDWHERETAEMFGIDVIGHPNLVPLLLPDPVVTAHPLRKEFVLPARDARPWPGDVEP